MSDGIFKKTLLVMRKTVSGDLRYQAQKKTSCVGSSLEKSKSGNWYFIIFFQIFLFT